MGMKVEGYLRYIARGVLLAVAGFWFIFALLSGAGQYGGGFSGIIKNLPNAIPWVVLFIFVYIAWRWEHIGGTLVALMGIGTIFMFDAEPIVLLAISFPLILLGAALVASWYFRRT